MPLDKWDMLCGKWDTDAEGATPGAPPRADAGRADAGVAHVLVEPRLIVRP